MIKPIFSIIIPIYNCEKYIIKTLKSLLYQKNNKFEIIIVNDGSTDNSLNKVEEFFENVDTKIKYKIITQQNRGVSAARNVGIQNSTGEYIYFIDADDYIENNTFRELTQIINNNRFDLIFFKYNQVNDSDILWQYEDKYKIINNINKPKEIMKLYLKEEIFICIGNAIYKKEIIDKYNLKFNENSSNGEDQEFICKYISYSNDIYFLQQCLFHYYKRKGSITNSNSIKRLDVVKSFVNLREHLLKINYDNEIIDILNNKKIVREIYYNLVSILKSLKISEVDKVLINVLFTEEIKNVLKNFNLYNYSVQEIKIFVLMKLFVINPNLFIRMYIRLYKYKNIFNLFNINKI